MRNKIFLFLSLCVSCNLYCQSNRENIKGNIINDSLSVENIHVINKNSGKATITDKYGEFLIPVKENDTLFISSIQFENKNIRITDFIVKHKKLTIILFLKINKLKEVIVKEHRLSGNLQTDIHTTNIKNVADEFTLELPNAGSIPIPSIDSLDIQLGLIMSMNLDAFYRRINGNFKKLKKLQQLEKEDEILKSIRNSITDNYFIESLKIPKDYIRNFLQYLVSKDIINLYIQNKKMEVINLLINESFEYRKFKDLD